MIRNYYIFLVGFLLFTCSKQPDTVILLSKDAAPMEQLAAKELRRYLYHRSDRLLPIRIYDNLPTKNAIVIGTKENRLFKKELPEFIEKIAPQSYLIKTRQKEDCKNVFICGGDAAGVLYGTYRFLEYFDIRFYLHGEVIPDKKIMLILPEVNEQNTPLFKLRGILPFHDFPEGPDWWNLDDYKAILSQLPKLGMNFIGFHTYPERYGFNGEGPKAEPLVWIGGTPQSNAEGMVTQAYPALHFHTQDSTWGYHPLKTSQFTCGADQLFDSDNYGADYMKNISPWPHTEDENIKLFNDMGKLLKSAFTFAQKLEVKTCIGTETPLTIPEKIEDALFTGKEPDVRSVYRGLFQRIINMHPLDYYWFWTPEDWTWKDVSPEKVGKTKNDLLLAVETAEELNAPFTLATCGWVLGPPQDRAAFDRLLPKEMPFSCINREVGFTPVEPAFKDLQGRPKWAIPWMEDDPALITPQLWVGRLRRDAVDAFRYGCDGLMGIHWRTRIIGPNIAALAKAGWYRGKWADEETESEIRDLPCEDFYRDWTWSQFGTEQLTPLFTHLDGGPLHQPGKPRFTKLPRTSDWIRGPGGIKPDFRPWQEVSKAYTFIDSLKDYEERIKGAGNRERFDYWLNTFKFSAATAQLSCVLRELEQAVEEAQAGKTTAEKEKTITAKALPKRMETVKIWQEMMRLLLETVSTPGELGTIANLEQHNRMLLNIINKHDDEITAITGQSMPPEAQIGKLYQGSFRIIVPAKRTVLGQNEDLRLTFMILSQEPLKEVHFHWRKLGEHSFNKQPVSHVTRGVYRIVLSAAAIPDEDFEYYISATAGENEAVYPATAPDICHSVVIF
jgi:hypothetical protein